MSDAYLGILQELVDEYEANRPTRAEAIDQIRRLLAVNADLLKALMTLFRKFAQVYEEDHPGKSVEALVEIQEARAVIEKVRVKRFNDGP